MRRIRHFFRTVFSRVLSFDHVTILLYVILVIYFGMCKILQTEIKLLWVLNRIFNVYVAYFFEYFFITLRKFKYYVKIIFEYLTFISKIFLSLLNINKIVISSQCTIMRSKAMLKYYIDVICWTTFRWYELWTTRRILFWPYEVILQIHCCQKIIFSKIFGKKCWYIYTSRPIIFLEFVCPRYRLLWIFLSYYGIRLFWILYWKIS